MAKASVSAHSTSSHLLVVAFDFGTTYSGYAFSFRDDPLKIQANQNWIAGSEKLISLKTPTCVLLSPDRKFHSFGYEAENKYSELTFEEEHSGWLLFRRFKMLLYKHKNLTRDAQIDDINGVPMEAMRIFTMSIRYLKDHFLTQLNNQVTGVKETDIQYVLTVPAIWDDGAKQFMREAAVKAGIETARLRLALEPEAASIWCQTLSEEALVGLAEFETKYMVVDLGGGTVDVSVHGVNSDGTLSELHRASGGPWGGTNVDNNYIDWLKRVYGRKAVERFMAEDVGGYFDLLREFENNKRSVKFNDMDSLMVRISATLKDFSEEEGENLTSRVSGMDVIIKRDKMKIGKSVVQQWFDKPVESIIQHIKEVLSEPDMSEVKTVLLVGGFAESKYVQEKIKHTLNDKRFIIPTDAGLAVLKGAVRFGHDPTLISTRVMNYTYGIEQYIAYDGTNYPCSTIIVVNGQAVVDHGFQKFISAGETLKVGQERAMIAVPANMEYSILPVFCSKDPDPIFTTDNGCVKLGFLKVEHAKGDTLDDKTMEVIIKFGDTELGVKAKIIKTGEEFDTIIDCLK